jgi:hypothetical protein
MRPLVLVPFVFVAFVSAVSPAPRGDDPPPREWNQPHGNAAGTAFVDVAPLKAPPAERWRIEAEQILAGPVVAQGKLLVALVEKGEAALLAVDPASGARLARVLIDSDFQPFSLIAGDGLAFLLAPNAVQVYRVGASDLSPEKKIAGAFAGEPTRYGSILLAPKSKGGGIVSIDANTGKAQPLLPKGVGRTSGAVDDPASDKGARCLFWLAADEKSGSLTLQRSPLASLAAPVKVAPAEALFPGAQAASLEIAQDSVLVATRTKGGLLWFGWFGGGQGSALLKKGAPKSLSFVAPPASANGHLYGVDSNDRLLDFDANDGSTAPMVEQDSLPKGAHLGTPSLARDTLYLGNWALELGSKRVLWCLEKLAVDGPAIPAGDELLVVRTRSNHLVGLGRAGTAAAPSRGGADPKAAALPLQPALLPGSKPGVIRADGLFIAGKATALDGGRWHVEPDGGKGVDLEASAVALVDTGAEVKRVGDELAVFRACWTALAQQFSAALVSVCEAYRDAKLYEDCTRLVVEASSIGLPASKADELNASFTGKNPAKLAATSPVRKKCVEAESDARAKSVAAMVEAAKWCAAHDAKTAATVLFARATAASPAKPPDPRLVEIWFPESFPFGDDDEAKAKEWLVWAQALLPSGATFPALDESTQRRISVTKFGTDAIILRSRNVFMLSRELDPHVMGTCMERAEAAIRALQKLLGPSPAGLRDDVPLEIHMHKTRAQYLDDRIIGSAPMVWSAGCYSPSDGISRFYSTMEGDQGDPLAHELHEVLAHEVTHHYVDRRWIRETRKQAPSGFWMVEGFAEFVAGQAVEMGRVGESFDDATVSAIDRAGATARAGQLLPLQYLMELDQARFQKELEGGRFGPVQLHHSLREAYMDKRAVFYAEATALTFFVMNRCGEKGRAAYTGWLARHYRGEALQEPWKELGFASFSAFDKKFQAFLDEL